MVGKSDFDENPVVSLDLDLALDFDLGFVNKLGLSWADSFDFMSCMAG